MRQKRTAGFLVGPLSVPAQAEGRPPRRAGRRGFTLVELLVVVAIIALLVAILLPILSTAKELARRAVDLSNQANLSKCATLYHAEFKTYPYNFADYVVDSWSPYSVTKDYGQWEVSYIDDLPTRVVERMALGLIGRYCGGIPRLPPAPFPRPGFNYYLADEWSTNSALVLNLGRSRFPKSYACPSADLNTLYSLIPSDKYHACYWTNMAIRVNMGYTGGQHGGGLLNYTDNTQRQPGNDNLLNQGPSCGRGWSNACRTPGCPGRTMYNPTEDTIAYPAETAFSGDTNDEPIHATWQNPNGGEAWRNAVRPGDYHVAMAPGWHQGMMLLGWQRHKGKIVVSYMDGHATVWTKEDVQAKFGHDADNGVSSDFLIKYSPAQQCAPGKTGYHTIPPMYTN